MKAFLENLLNKPGGDEKPVLASASRDAEAKPVPAGSSAQSPGGALKAEPPARGPEASETGAFRVTLELGDFFNRIPPRLLAPCEADLRRPLPFEVVEIADCIARGIYTIPLKRLLGAAPDIFLDKALEERELRIAFPWRKLRNLVITSADGEALAQTLRRLVKRMKQTEKKTAPEAAKGGGIAGVSQTENGVPEAVAKAGESAPADERKVASAVVSDSKESRSEPVLTLKKDAPRDVVAPEPLRLAETKTTEPVLKLAPAASLCLINTANPVPAPSSERASNDAIRGESPPPGRPAPEAKTGARNAGDAAQRADKARIAQLEAELIALSDRHKKEVSAARAEAEKMVHEAQAEASRIGGEVADQFHIENKRLAMEKRELMAKMEAGLATERGAALAEKEAEISRLRREHEQELQDGIAQKASEMARVAEERDALKREMDALKAEFAQKTLENERWRAVAEMESAAAQAAPSLSAKAGAQEEIEALKIAHERALADSAEERRNASELAAAEREGFSRDKEALRVGHEGRVATLVGEHNDAISAMRAQARERESQIAAEVGRGCERLLAEQAGALSAIIAERDETARRLAVAEKASAESIAAHRQAMQDLESLRNQMDTLTSERNLASEDGDAEVSRPDDPGPHPEWPEALAAELEAIISERDQLAELLSEQELRESELAANHEFELFAMRVESAHVVGEACDNAEKKIAGLEAEFSEERSRWQAEREEHSRAMEALRLELGNQLAAQFDAEISQYRQRLKAVLSEREALALAMEGARRERADAMETSKKALAHQQAEHERALGEAADASLQLAAEIDALREQIASLVSERKATKVKHQSEVAALRAELESRAREFEARHLEREKALAGQAEEQRRLLVAERVEAEAVMAAVRNELESVRREIISERCQLLREIAARARTSASTKDESTAQQPPAGEAEASQSGIGSGIRTAA